MKIGVCKNMGLEFRWKEGKGKKGVRRSYCISISIGSIMSRVIGSRKFSAP